MTPDPWASKRPASWLSSAVIRWYNPLFLSFFFFFFLPFSSFSSSSFFFQFSKKKKKVLLTRGHSSLPAQLTQFYGLWGDSNGHHGERPSVGEASLSLATACYGKGMNGGSGSNSSHNEADVLYIAFTGKDAVPGRAGAHWRADHFDAFHNSIESLGNKLVNRIGRGRQ